MVRTDTKGLEEYLDKAFNRDRRIAGDFRLHRVLEISRQIDALRREQEQIIRSLLPESEPELFFDDMRRRIYWGGGSVKLGKKAYFFIKTVWLGENHRADFAELEENVWTQHVETEMFVARRTVSMLVQYTQKNLTEANFPYRIETLKNFSNQELEGFRLVLMNSQKKILPSQEDRAV